MKCFYLSALIVLNSAAPGYAQFTFTPIDYPGGTLTTARSINERGDIVGSYRVQYPRHALLIKGDGFIPLAPETILGTMWSEAFKSNNRGDVVGLYGPPDEVYGYGFLLSRSGVTTLIFPGADLTTACGINESGTVVGSWSRLDEGGNTIEEHGFIWEEGDFAEVSFPADWKNTAILGINDLGEFVGVWSPDSNWDIEHGFVYSKRKFISFDVPFSGSKITQPNDINNLGHVVGTYGDSVNLHGFLLVRTAFTSIDYPGAEQTSAWGINSAGKIVGNYHVTVGDQAPRGYLAQLDK